MQFDAEALAKKTEGFSGADLRAVFDLAVGSTLQEAMKKGEMSPVSGKMLLKTTKKVKPSIRRFYLTPFDALNEKYSPCEYCEPMSGWK